MASEEMRVEELAQRIAANGASYLPRYQRALERARQILASGEPGTIQTQGSPLYLWELGEPAHPPNAMPRLFTAAVDGGATGEGAVLQFMARLARDEVEFRRHLALRVGPHVANNAEIRTGAADLAPFNTVFVSPELKVVLEQVDAGALPTFSYFARFYAHYR
ncbi:hypothetical protein [Sphingomonas sp. LM7]|uniref:hypothetical protein n=1 Tax=Sphingomonas sp. LM7 TaxID=1938607 RepID=UPI000983C7D0|nr:hypothetical protein [Sphingomonas sp. LM7]AQR72864.1 hypothetical protein BXU08_03495 [Sphingomonas sp. LM7]